MLLDTFLCMVLILGFLSFLQAYDRGGTCYRLSTVPRSMEGPTPTTLGVHKKNPDWVKINSPEELDEELDDG